MNNDIASLVTFEKLVRHFDPRFRGDWVIFVIQLLEPDFVPKERPIIPYELNGWSPKLIKAARESKYSDDVNARRIWRKWRDEYLLITVDNVDKLSVVATAYEKSLRQSRPNEERTLKEFMVYSWAIGDEHLRDYVAGSNRLTWAKAHAQISRPVGNAWLDPDGLPD